jgi:hypothetical protein
MPTVDVHLLASGATWGTSAIPIDAAVGLALSGGLTNVPVAVTVTDPLPEIKVAVKELPKINVGLDPIRLVLDPLRCHLPMDLSICFSLFGHQIAGIRICGEAQVITEPYVPNPCECAPKRDHP